MSLKRYNEGDDDLRIYSLSGAQDLWFLSHDQPVLPHVTTHSRLRLAQCRAYLDEHQRLTLARTIVVSKIATQSLWLNRHDLNGDFSQGGAASSASPRSCNFDGYRR
jgi:CRISPR/Cas system-associated endonuclease Cas1